MSDSPSTSVTFDPISTYGQHLADIKALDERLESVKGTMAEVEKKGKTWAETVKISDLRLMAGIDKKTWVGETIAPIANAETVSDYITALSDALSAGQMVHETIKNEYITANSGPDQTSAIVVKRAESVKAAEALAIVVGQLQVAKMPGLGTLDEDGNYVPISLDPIPPAPNASTRNRATGVPKAGARKHTVTTVGDDGKETITIRDGYDWSLLAFHKPFETGVKELKRAMTAAGWDGEEGETNGPLSLEWTTKEGVVRKGTLSWSVTNPPLEGDKK